MSKKPTAGSEVDAYCTKCKLDLNHRIIAMEGTRIKRVECLTCRGHHNYRRPKSAAPTPRRRAKAKTKTRARRAPAVPSYQARWLEATAEQLPNAYSAYDMSARLAAGQLVHHTKFGNGVVEELVEGGKVRVLFEAGVKTLVHCR